MSNLLITEAQPSFPLLDLTQRNAEALEIMLANKMELERQHTSSEIFGGLVFRAAHPAIVESTSRAYEGAQVQVISHGITLFEAISGYVVSKTNEGADRLAVGYNAEVLMNHTDEKSLRKQAIESAEIFTAEMPRTAEVIAAGTKRFYGGLTHYAILGAAMERQFQLDSLTPLS